jgi:hypothetical protein
MVIIGPNGARANGIQWYWALRLTTAKRPGYHRIGPILGDKDSYTEVRQHTIPANLIGAVTKELDPIELGLILRIAGLIPGRPLREARSTEQKSDRPQSDDAMRASAGSPDQNRGRPSVAAVP